MLTGESTDNTFSPAKIITTSNDTIIGMFRESIKDGFVQRMNSGNKIIFTKQDVKYAYFRKHEFPFIQLETLKNIDRENEKRNVWEVLSATNKSSSDWVELIVDGDVVSLYRGVISKQTYNYSTGGVSRTGSSFYVIVINGEPRKLETSFFESERKSVKTLFSDYPYVVSKVDSYYDLETSNLPEFIKLLNMKSGKRLLENKV